MQVKLKAALPRVIRPDGAVQVGLSTRHGTLLQGLTGDDRRFLEHLTRGVDPGPLPPRHGTLLDLLGEAGVLCRSAPEVLRRPKLAPTTAARLTPDAACWAVAGGGDDDGWDRLLRRRGRHVRIHGSGRLVPGLASTLAAAGVGYISVHSPALVSTADVTPAGARPAEIGKPVQQVAEEGVRRYGGRQSPADRTVPPDLVVLVDPLVADSAAASALVSADITHLSVVTREDGVLIGPLVVPGRSPCLRCLDLHRTDRDPQWPGVLVQLLAARSAGPAPVETGIAAVAVGLACLQVTGLLDALPGPVQGQVPAAWGATLEVEPPDGLVARRRWPVHPRCGCCWPPPSERLEPSD